MTSRPATPQHLRDLTRLRRVRDRIDREYAQPLETSISSLALEVADPTAAVAFYAAFGVGDRVGVRTSEAPTTSCCCSVSMTSRRASSSTSTTDWR